MSDHPANSQDSGQYGWHPPQTNANAITIGLPARTARTQVCPECGEQVQSHMAHCPACGESLVRPPRPVRCMHCHTTASSELVLCPGCGRELREAPPKFVTVGVPALLALLVVLVLASQWSRISPIAWARVNLLRGVVLVEDLSASIEPEMVIVMTPIVEQPEDDMPAASSEQGLVVNDAQAVALAANNVLTASVVTPLPEVVAGQGIQTSTVAAVPQESPIGVGGPESENANGEAANGEANPTPQSLPTETAMPTSTPLATDTPLPTPTPTLAATATQAPAQPTAAKSGMAATLASNAATPTPTWTLVAANANSDSGLDASSNANSDDEVKAAGSSLGGMAQVAAANETSLPTATATATVPTTPLPTPTATPVVYQVKSGDTLVTIAAAYDVDVDELMTANNISAQDVFVLQPGQMLYIPLPTPTPNPAMRVEAPVLLVPPDQAAVGCATGGTLIWQRVQFVKDSDQYLLHLGFVSGQGSDGQEEITWVLAQSGPVTKTEWELDTSLCELAPDQYDHQWRWWVEVLEAGDGGPVSVSPPSEIHGFTWK